MISISDLILAAGGTAAVVIIAIGYSGKLLLNKMTSRFQHEYNEKIIKLTNELSKSNSLLGTAQTILMNNVMAVNEYRIKILENIWKNTFVIRDSVPTYTHTTLMLLGESKEQWSITHLKNIQPPGQDNRYNNILRERQNMVDEKENNNKFQKWKTVSQFLSDNRPFISEELYQLVWLHNLLLYRIPDEFIRNVWLHAFTEENFQNQKNPHEYIPHWREDEHIVKSIKKVLTQEDAQEVLKPRFGSFKEATDYVQMKILFRIREEMTGKHESADNLKALLLVESLKASIEKDYAEKKE